MSHVDEGALHAYLDGALDEYLSADAERIRAHLDACADCAERLEEERRIRSDAHAMLGLAAPVVELPSLEELRAYVQRTAQQRRGISRLQRMGWAASVVLALGAGWMLRGGQLEYGLTGSELSAPTAGAASSADADPGSDAASSPILARSADMAGREAMAEAAGAGAAAEEGRRSLSAPASLDAFADAESSDRTNAPAVAVQASATEAAAPAESPVDALDASVSTADELQKTSEGVAGAIALSEARVALDSQVRQEQAPEAQLPPEAPVGLVVTAARTPIAASGDSAAAAAEPRADADDSERRAREAPSSVASNAVQVDGVGGGRTSDAPSRSLIIEREEADDEAVVEPLLSVPGHEVVDVTNLGEGSTPWGARVRQRTDDGESFEVFHLEPGIDPSILPPMEVGVGEASTETAFGWVLVRGALDEQMLAGLLMRLFPEAP